jgi:hypothetical protein
VVEHSLGKGEVTSSNLVKGFSTHRLLYIFSADFCRLTARQIAVFLFTAKADSAEAVEIKPGQVSRSGTPFGHNGCG